MSVWDDRNLEIAAQRQAARPAPAQATDDQNRDAPYPFGGFAGVVAIIASILLIPVTGGLSLIGLVPGVYAIAARKREKRTFAEMWQGADNYDQAAIDKAATSGCIDTCLMTIVMLVIVAVLCVAVVGGL